MSTTEAEFIQLRAENEALKALLAKHGIAVPQPSKFNIGDAALQPTLMTRTGAKIPERCYKPASTMLSPQRWKYRAPARELTFGYSLRTQRSQEMRDVLARR